MILILESGFFNIITNYKNRLQLSATTDINTIFLQEQGKYYFGDGEIQVIPDVPNVISLERGSNTTQHLTIEADEVTTMFNELHMPNEMKPDDLPFEFLRAIKDGYRLSNFHTRAWIFDKQFGRHFSLAGPSFFNGTHKTLLDAYMDSYKSFSSLTDLGVFRLSVDNLYENIDKFTGTNYDQLHKWESNITVKAATIINISFKDLDMIEPLASNIDPRSADAKAKSPMVVPQPVEAPPKPVEEAAVSK